ncbi:MAG: SRPBCC family protein [Acidobacteriota bacterium]
MEVEKQRNQIGGATRWLSLVGGSAAVWYGLRRKSLFGSAVALAGTNYVVRGISGQGDLLEYLGLTGRRGAVPYGQGIKIRRSATVNKPREELYRFWKDFENFPRFMKHVESVRVIDDRRSHWVVKGPAGQTVEWDAEIVANRENEMIGWRSTGGTVDHAGSVRFEPAPGGRGTVVRVQLQYKPPAGRIGASIARLLGKAPDQQIAEDLHRFKQLVETGEILTTDGQPSGRAGEPLRLRFEEAPQREATARRGPVEIASEESFPASDAPSWTAGGGRA